MIVLLLLIVVRWRWWRPILCFASMIPTRIGYKKRLRLPMTRWWMITWKKHKES
jgi:hypothetical protein